MPQASAGCLAGVLHILPGLPLPFWRCCCCFQPHGRTVSRGEAELGGRPPNLHQTQRQNTWRMYEPILWEDVAWSPFDMGYLTRCAVKAVSRERGVQWSVTHTTVGHVHLTSSYFADNTPVCSLGTHGLSAAAPKLHTSQVSARRLSTGTAAPAQQHEGDTNK